MGNNAAWRRTYAAKHPEKVAASNSKYDTSAKGAARALRYNATLKGTIRRSRYQRAQETQQLQQSLENLK